VPPYYRHQTATFARSVGLNVWSRSREASHAALALSHLDGVHRALLLVPTHAHAEVSSAVAPPTDAHARSADMSDDGTRPSAAVRSADVGGRDGTRPSGEMGVAAGTVQHAAGLDGGKAHGLCVAARTVHAAALAIIRTLPGAAQAAAAAQRAPTLSAAAAQPVAAQPAAPTTTTTTTTPPPRAPYHTWQAAASLVRDVYASQHGHLSAGRSRARATRRTLKPSAALSADACGAPRCGAAGADEAASAARVADGLARLPSGVAESALGDLLTEVAEAVASAVPPTWPGERGRARAVRCVAALAAAHELVHV
jgi:hypothetical protein